MNEEEKEEITKGQGGQGLISTIIHEEQIQLKKPRKFDFFGSSILKTDSKKSTIKNTLRNPIERKSSAFIR